MLSRDTHVADSRLLNKGTTELVSRFTNSDVVISGDRETDKQVEEQEIHVYLQSKCTILIDTGCIWCPDLHMLKMDKQDIRRRKGEELKQYALYHH